VFIVYYYYIPIQLERQAYLINICSLVQLKLRKWDSFNSELLQTISEDARAMSPSVLFNSSEQSKFEGPRPQLGPFI